MVPPTAKQKAQNSSLFRGAGFISDKTVLTKHLRKCYDSANFLNSNLWWGISYEKTTVMYAGRSGIADRILVMYEGEIVGELDPKKTTVEELGLYMAGAKKQGKEAAV